MPVAKQDQQTNEQLRERDENDFALWTRPLKQYEHALSVLPDEWTDFYEVRAAVRDETGRHGKCIDERTFGKFLHRCIKNGVLETRSTAHLHDYDPKKPRRAEIRCVPMPERPVVDPAAVRAERFGVGGRP